MLNGGESDGAGLQYSCLENPTVGGAQAAVLGVAKSRTRLNDFTFTYSNCGILWFNIRKLPGRLVTLSVNAE